MLLKICTIKNSEFDNNKQGLNSPIISKIKQKSRRRHRVEIEESKNCENLRYI